MLPGEVLDFYFAAGNPLSPLSVLEVATVRKERHSDADKQQAWSEKEYSTQSAMPELQQHIRQSGLDIIDLQWEPLAMPYTSERILRVYLPMAAT